MPLGRKRTSMLFSRDSAPIPSNSLPSPPRLALHHISQILHKRPIFPDSVSHLLPSLKNSEPKISLSIEHRPLAYWRSWSRSRYEGLQIGYCLTDAFQCVLNDCVLGAFKAYLVIYMRKAMLAQL